MKIVQVNNNKDDAKWHLSGVFIVNFEQIAHLVFVLPEAFLNASVAPINAEIWFEGTGPIL